MASIIATVEILHPVMICYLPAPTEHEHFLPGFMVRFTRGVGNLTTHPVGKYVVGAATIFLFVGSTYIALFHSKIGEASRARRCCGRTTSGTSPRTRSPSASAAWTSLVVYSDGDRQNASADPEPDPRHGGFERT